MLQSLKGRCKRNRQLLYLPYLHAHWAHDKNVESSTDEISAQLTYCFQRQRNYQAWPRQTYPRFFSKKLTPSGISSTVDALSRSVMPMMDVFHPWLDMSQETPQQELLATDLHGHQWPPKKEFAYQRLEYRPCNSVRHGTRSLLTVYYRPWTRSSEFITPLDQYLKSVQFHYCIGTRFQMSIEGEESRNKELLALLSASKTSIIFGGPILNGDVKWDNPASSSALPERVCPWRVDPTEVTKMKKPLTLHPQKRARPNDASSPEFSSLPMDGMLHGSAKHQSQNSSGALQVQENSNTCANQSGALRQSLLHFLPQHPGRTSMQQQMPKQLEIQIPICNPFYHYTSSTAFYSYGVHYDSLASKTFSVPNVDSPKWRTLELRNENETSLSEPKGGHRYMLFGVNLANGSPGAPFTTSTHFYRSCTKVLKYGLALGRIIDLYRFNGYEELIVELDHMFGFNGRLIDGSSGWNVTYIDGDGDMVLIGDHCTWQLSAKLNTNSA
ncbi:hypothetical protein V6N11_079549 [Hibiscus sabdariffa]|uniref:PB1 domain-containing protein n=1 Tax=Hibiscus sabdariffa TaxID=183260 RepID=A0ABR2RW88_9ROSI